MIEFRPVASAVAALFLGDKKPGCFSTRDKNIPLSGKGFLLPSAPMPGASDPDAELMLRVKQGDMAAFEALVEKYKLPVLNLVYRTVPDPTEAEDLAQSVFIQVFRSAGRYEHSAKFSTWLYTIARNLSLNEIRRRSRHPAESLDEPHGETEDMPARQHEDLKVRSATDHLLENELYLKVQEALRDLPEKQRTAILLYQEKEMPYEEIAKVLKCSLSATKSLIHRGRETLKQRLKPYLRTGLWHSTPPENE